MKFNVAVVGATGNVGREMFNILAERDFPVNEITPLASRQSIGTEVAFANKTLKVKALEDFDFKDTDFCLMSAGSAISERWAALIGKRNVMVIDNSSFWRYHSDVPLIVPEVNSHVLDDYMKSKNRKNIIANPNCSTAQLVVALKPLHDYASIKRVVIATYQSVSGAGKKALDELWHQTRAIFVNDPVIPEEFSRQIAFNVIPHIDTFMADGSSREEWKLVAETKKILDSKIKLTATAVRVPVFVGHGEAVNIEFNKAISADKAREILRDAPGIMVVDNPEQEAYATPIEIVGEYESFVSRIREDATVANGLNMWVVSDNLRKGAALNTIQIAESLIEKNLIAPKSREK